MSGSRPYAADVLPGLEPLAAGELKAAGAARLAEGRGGLTFTFSGDAARLLGLRLATSVYELLSFLVPRPRALLGSEHLRRLGAALARIAAAAPSPFAALRLAAAGSDSAVFTRLAAELSALTGLPHDPVGGDLLIRVRPGKQGWEVLVRLTARPLSTRAWRVCHRPGGLNATLAVALNQLTGNRPADRYLNLMCGSGTLLVERALVGSARALVGVDLDAEALACAARNLRAASVAVSGVPGANSPAQAATKAPRKAPEPGRGPVELLRADVRELGLAGHASAGLEPFDVITADAPWGDAVGDHAGNAELHEQLLACAARLSRTGSRFALLSHELRLVRSLLGATTSWRLDSELQISHGGHHPVLWLFTRI